MNISVSDVAIEQFSMFMKNEEIPDTGGVRIGVMPGGCSGFKYSLTVEDTPVEDDIMFDRKGVRFFIDPFSAQYLDNTSIDYYSSMMGSGFKIDNPNASGGCGCGSSFGV